MVDYSTLDKRGWKIYRVNDSLSFAMNDSKILVMTSLCSYIVTDTHLNSRAGHNRIRKGIMRCKYNSLADVITDMRLRPGIGVGYRMISAKELV